MKYVICTIMIMMAMSGLRAESIQKVSIDLSVDELRALVKVLDDVVHRAPRLDAPTADSPSYPVVSSDAADLALIESALCSLRALLIAVIGNVNSPGSCFPAITTIADIDNATLNVIAWLKTLMRELRGVCVP